MIILGMMQVSKKIAFDDPQVLMSIRGVYIFSNVVIAVVYLVLQSRINSKKGTVFIISSKPSPKRPLARPCLINQQDSPANPNFRDVNADLTTLKYVEPAPMGSAEEPKLITTTVHSYDLQQLRALWKSQLMGIGMMCVMHIYFKYTNPLLIQSIIPLKGAFEGNLVKIHLFGQPAVGDLKRPWKAAGGFMGMGGEGPKADKKSIELAERAGSGGIKEE